MVFVCLGVTLTGLEDQEGRQLDLDDLESLFNSRVLIFFFWKVTLKNHQTYAILKSN